MGRTAARIVAHLDMLVLIVLVIGGIALGWISPTEAASIGVSGALLIALLRRRLTLPMLQQAFGETLRTSGMIYWW